MTAEASVDALAIQYQSLRMGPIEKVIKFVNRLKKDKNKLLDVGHLVSGAEQKRVLQRGLRPEFAVTARVICATEKTLQDAVGLLVIQKAETGRPEKDTSAEKEHVFAVKITFEDREC